MGYCMQQINDKFCIKVENQEGALKAIKDLAGGETIKDASGLHYSWVITEEFLKAKTLDKAIKAWNWYVYIDDVGDMRDIEFLGEKLGDDEILFSAIAPFVDEGSYIEMDGEDGSKWRWIFSEGKCIEKSATISWE